MKLKKIIFHISVAVSIGYISLLLYLGLIFGYFSAKIFLAGKIDLPRRIGMIKFKLRNYQFHLHHWLLSLILIIIALFKDLMPFMPRELFFGILGGIIVQDIYWDKDWHRVISRHKNLKT